ncbi:MAG TPA: hypothetical protein GXX53_05895 [Tissierellia bacterium]|nr:hypothetical protein [Tissierellia bacterium]
MEKKYTMVEIWGDVIRIKDLIVSVAISSIFTMAAYFLAPSNNRVRELFYGLLGAVLGFIVTNVLIKPKRVIVFEENLKGNKG